MKKVGVLLPVYKNDNLEYFQMSIKSILNQSYSNFIILVGVDGEVDSKMREILNEYDKINKVEVCWFDINRGLACVLNDLIDRAREYNCDFYARMDADDISVVDRFEKQVYFLLSNEDVDVVGGAIEEIDENSIKNGKKVNYPISHKECKKFFAYRDPLAHPAVMFSKSFFDKVSGYRVEYRKNQDTMLWFDGFNNNCKFSNLPDVLLLFRVTSDFYNNRRSGIKRAKKMLNDRFFINKVLSYGIKANFFALLSFILTISPSFIKKIAYKLR